MKYRSCWPIFILRSKFESHCLIIWKYDIQPNSLGDTRQNHLTMKYRSQWSTFILRSNVGSYWFIIPNKDAHTSNSLQNTRQNHWTMKYSSHWPTFILRSNVGPYWFILPKYYVHTSNSLQNMRQNHWTVKCRSCWSSIHDPQVHVTRLSHVLPTVCIFFSITEKVEKTLLKILTSRHSPMEWSRPSRVPMVQIWMLSDEWLLRYTPLEKF